MHALSILIPRKGGIVEVCGLQETDDANFLLEQDGIRDWARCGNIDVAICPWLHGHQGFAWAVECPATIPCCNTWTSLLSGDAPRDEVLDQSFPQRSVSSANEHEATN